MCFCWQSGGMNSEETALHPISASPDEEQDTCCASFHSACTQSVSESESGYISSSHIRLIRCLAVIGQASFRREHLV